MTSMPFWNLIPWTTFGNWFSPFNRRHVFAAALTSLNTVSLAVLADRAPWSARFDDAPSQIRSRSGLTCADGPSARPGSRRRRAELPGPFVKQATALSYLASYLAPYLLANTSMAASAAARVGAPYIAPGTEFSFTGRSST